MKKYADMKRSERHFSVGDWVYMKLQPYKQVSIPGHTQSKLNPKYYGPYEVLEKVGPVAYKLNLPAGTAIHPVIHVSLLKGKKGEGREINSQLPMVGPDGELRIEPIQLLDRRVVKRNNVSVVQWLVQWFNRPIEAATWEDYEELAMRYPHFILEGKNLKMGEVMSREKERETSRAEMEGLGAVEAPSLNKSEIIDGDKPGEALIKGKEGQDGNSTLKSMTASRDVNGGVDG